VSIWTNDTRAPRKTMIPDVRGAKEKQRDTTSGSISKQSVAGPNPSGHRNEILISSQLAAMRFPLFNIGLRLQSRHQLRATSATV
jgi:hypothetical protein